MGTSRVKVLKYADSYYTTIYEPRVLPVESVKEDHQVTRLGPSLPATSLWPAGLNTGKPPAKRSPRAGGVFPPRALLLALPPLPPSLLVPFEPAEKRQEDEPEQLSGVPPFSLRVSPMPVSYTLQSYRSADDMWLK